MTREEAIEVYNGLINTKIKEAFEFFVPELAESEDERIRKEIISIVKAYRENCIDEGTHRFDDCLSWLEKQKDNLGKIEALKDALAKQPVFSPFTWEDVKRIVRIADGMMYPAESLVDAEIRLSIEQYYQQVLEKYLSEKQKENPQTADSIPSDCASNAKCENSWHNVQDSLPDNGREVLAKDKLGNLLLARYDGEGWDVSVYDNDDYRCHNGVSRWMDIPSERQKEQE